MFLSVNQHFIAVFLSYCSMQSRVLIVMIRYQSNQCRSTSFLKPFLNTSKRIYKTANWEKIWRLYFCSTTIWLSLSDCCSVVSSVVSNGSCCWNQHCKALIACWCGIARWVWRCWKGRRLHHNCLVSTHCAYFRTDRTPFFNSCHRSRGLDWRGHFGIDNLLRGRVQLLRWLTF